MCRAAPLKATSERERTDADEFMKPEEKKITINAREIVIHLDSSEPIVIPRSKLRTRLELLGWTYTLAGHPGITLQHLRAFIGAMFRHHGWALPSEERAPASRRADDSYSDNPKTAWAACHVSLRRSESLAHA